MRALIYLLPLLIAFAVGYGVAALSNRRTRRELAVRREEHDALMRDCLAAMDVDPFARTVYDTLTTHQKAIDQ